MQRSILKTDIEPIDPAKNPVITRDEAVKDSTCTDVVETMDYLERTSLTRLQYIEFLMWQNELSRWDRQYECDWIPDPLQAEWEEYYVPSYLKGKRPRNVDVFFGETERTDA